jgi:hypothetical protein
LCHQPEASDPCAVPDDRGKTRFLLAIGTSVAVEDRGISQRFKEGGKMIPSSP